MEWLQGWNVQPDLLVLRLRHQILPHLGELVQSLVVLVIVFWVTWWLSTGVLVVSWSLFQLGLAYAIWAICRLIQPMIVSLVLLYAHRICSCSWLRQEWRDFFTQGFATGKVTCTICLEEVPQTPWHLATLPCCNGVLCWACVRRHVQSVIDEGRPEMRCPLLPCRVTLTDLMVRAAFRREQWSWPTLDPLGNLARRKQRAYERWVLTTGLAASCSARSEDVLHCPRANCNHLWVMPRELRARKGQAEPQSVLNPQSWAFGRCVGLYTPPVEQGDRDARRLLCPACKLEHCLLCGMPWQRDNCQHDGKSCIEHRRSFPKTHGDRSQWAGARPCPGCGVRILRSMGCNHMTCTQCGHQWCYVCLASWNPRHYGCRSGDWSERTNGEACAIQ
mmetsp:Transcript_11844/g.22942  ORF Transcript_11844/g.22942 Transcript_11844/m.22942 type:complete len:390 (-) Transcript_11844:15-1184(-)